VEASARDIAARVKWLRHLRRRIKSPGHSPIRFFSGRPNFEGTRFPGAFFCRLRRRIAFAFGKTPPTKNLPHIRTLDSKDLTASSGPLTIEIRISGVDRAAFHRRPAFVRVHPKNLSRTAHSKRGWMARSDQPTVKIKVTIAFTITPATRLTAVSLRPFNGKNE
jgi:hypothetical protein